MSNRGIFAIPPIRTRFRVAVLGLMAGLLVALGLPVGATPAAVAANAPLTITKRVDQAKPKPGQIFTYEIQVFCDETNCLDTKIVDELPAGLIGFPIQSVSLSPGQTKVPRVVTWLPGGGSTAPAAVAAGTTLSVDLKQAISQTSSTGLEAGQNFTILISLKVPDNYPPGTSPDIVNTAKVSASNLPSQSASATINVVSPVMMGVAVDKTWSPVKQNFEPGASSTIVLASRNSSNTAVDTISIQEPRAAANGAAALDASNPFTITDFQGFKTTALPATCTKVRVDTYVKSGGTWNWSTGSPTATPVSLDTLVQGPLADVGGIRVTCEKGIAPGQSIKLDLGLEQRETHRNDGSDLSIGEHKVDNVAVGTATLVGQTSATKFDDASFVVVPAIPTVEVAKGIAPQRVTAGQSATATITPTNGSVPVKEMRVSDLGFFTHVVKFGGFTEAPAWPAGASSAAVIYRYADNSTSGEIAFADGAKPAAPDSAKTVTGFEVVWRGTTIEAAAMGQVKVGINTTEDATGALAEVALTNTAKTVVTAPNGLTAPSTDTAELAIVKPIITTSLVKTVLPSAAVRPGESVISSLKSQTLAEGDGAYTRDVVIEDSVGTGAAEFWNAFNLKSIAPTQVPAATKLTIQVQDSTGTWRTLAVRGPAAATTVAQLDEVETAAALAGLGLTANSVKGIRFSFHHDTGLPADITLTPNIEFEARTTLRDGKPITPGPNKPTAYKNTAEVDASGKSKGGANLGDDAIATGVGNVVTDPGNLPGPGVQIRKRWTKSAVDAQSSQQADTRLDWRVSRGHNPVVIADSAEAPAKADVARTVFDAFDLVAIKSIGASSVPYSNGWYLKYDTVTQVELFNGTSWITVAAPSGSWMSATRGFKGHVLTKAQRDSTLAVRITLQETAADTVARVAAQSPGGALDAFAPKPNSGVGSGSVDRRFDLTWQVRDKARSDDAFVVKEKVFNATAAGRVKNTVSVTGWPAAPGVPVTGRDEHTIEIMDPVPMVSVTKTATPTEPIFVPPVGTDPALYPKATWTVVGHNASTARASYVRLTDPATCPDTTTKPCESSADPAGALANPFDLNADHLGASARPNPQNRFDVTSVKIAATIPAEVSFDHSVVWLLRYDEATKTYSSEKSTVTAVNAGVSNPQNIVGMSVTFQPVNPALSGGTITQANKFTITFNTVLRPTLRNTGANQVLRAGDAVDVVNRVFAQSYDPIASPNEKAGDIDEATVVLTGGVVNIAPTKSVTPVLINQPKPDVPVTVTLGADQGSTPRSTLSPKSVVIEDQAKSAAFWNSFEFTGLGAVTLPLGADRVRVDLYDGAAWVNGTSAASATLPATPALDKVQGIRFTFTRADGKLFSAQVPAVNWAAKGAFKVKLRATYRDSGLPMQFAGTVTNTQTSQSFRDDANDSAPKDATAEIELSKGTRELAVHKLTNEGTRLAAVGDEVPFDLTFQNVGTGNLTITQLRDVLPAELAYTGSVPSVFNADTGGSLSEDVTVTPDTDGRALTFNWPAEGRQMKPGETFVIRVFLELQPGLGTGATATNTMTVHTAETLTRCVNTVSGGGITNAWTQDKTTCGTSDYVGTVPGPNLFTVKGVRGSLPGAYEPGNAAATCAASLAAAGGSYYRSPCVAHSQVDGVDDWVLRNQNAGTVDITEMTVFDQLPVRGDRMLLSGNGRGSTFRPQVVPGSLKVAAPNGTIQTQEVTTSPQVCVDTWANLENQPVCEQSGERWSVADGSTDWTKVTGIRVHLDFTKTTAKVLKPGQFADVTFSTKNVLATAADASGASPTVPGVDEIAWNQHGVLASYLGGRVDKLTPNKVGVHLGFGSVQIDKVVTGPAASYAPGAYRVDVACVAGGVPLDLGARSTVTLNQANNLTARIDGIPISAMGTSCTMTEQGPVGRFGETTRSGSPVTLAVTTLADPTAPGAGTVPAAQIATITNDYQFTGLSVTKAVDTQATDVDLGPYDFSLSCRSASGDPVLFDGQGTKVLDFTLTAGQKFTAPANTIPVRANCTLTEEDSSHADRIVVVGDNVVDNGDGTASITPGITPAAVVVTNAYDAGTVTIGKQVDGPGAGVWGTSDFSFGVVCTYQGQKPFDGSFTLKGGDTRTLGPYPAGTTCEVVETGAGGATATAMQPTDGRVTIVAPADPADVSNVSVTATNTFELTSLEVQKTITGDLSAKGARGAFEVELSCTWMVDGKRVALDVPGGAERVLSRANGYRTSFDQLPFSTACELTETETGGASSTTMESKVDGVVHQITGESIAVDLSQTGAPGHASVAVVNQFDSEDVLPGVLPDAGSPVRMWLVGFGALLLLAGAATLIARRRTV